MLKTLRITSLIASDSGNMRSHCCCILGIEGRLRNKGLYRKTGHCGGIKRKNRRCEGKGDVVSPLVAQAKAFALRIDPRPSAGTRKTKS